MTRTCPLTTGSVGKRAVARRSGGSRVNVLAGLKRVSGGLRDFPLWVDLRLKVGTVHALIDTGAQFSCFRVDVTVFVHLMGEPCHFKSCSMVCSLANGQRCDVTDAVKLRVKVMSFSWDHEFKIMKGPFHAILRLDF